MNKKTRFLEDNPDMIERAKISELLDLIILHQNDTAWLLNLKAKMLEAKSRQFFNTFQAYIYTDSSLRMEAKNKLAYALGYVGIVG